MAQRLGVSTATISRALNPSTAHMVKESRRIEILKLADELRFRPNPGTRLIQKGVSNTIAVLIRGQHEVSFSDLYGSFLAGVIHAMEHTDWDVRIGTLKRSGGRFIDDLRSAALGASGLIYAGIPLNHDEVCELSDYNTPMVLMSSALPNDYPIEKVGCHVVGVDNYKGALAAVKHVVQLGHRDIGFILGQGDSRDFCMRERGYRDGLKQMGIALDEDMFFYGSSFENSGRAGCQYFLSGKKRPTALICASDSLAISALYCAKDFGLSCPVDLSIVGFDDGPWAVSTSPQLTTVRQPLGQMTDRAVNILMQSILGGKSSLVQLELPASLHIRESVASVAK